MLYVKLILFCIFLSVTCQAKKTWKKEGRIQGCWIAPLENGIIVEPQNQKKVARNQYVVYSCIDGYELTGLSKRKCRKTKWNKMKLLGTIPTCKVIPPTTLPPPPAGCYYNGEFHKPGVIETVTSAGGVVCSSTHCSESGEIMIADNFDPECTGNPLTTLPPTPPPPGCEDNGKFYKPGTVISEEKSSEGVVCSSTFCDEDDQIVVVHNPDPACSGNPLTTLPPPPPPGCNYNGVYYEPGSIITEEKSPEGVVCSTTYCDESGDIVIGDNFKPGCPGHPGTTKPPTTTLPPGCEYNGEFYEPGIITEEKSPEGVVCSTTYCDESGGIFVADNFDCYLTRTPTTYPPDISPH